MESLDRHAEQFASFCLGCNEQLTAYAVATAGDEVLSPCGKLTLLCWLVRRISSSAGFWLLSAGLQIVIFPLPGLYGLAWIAVAPLLVAILRARVPETLQLDGQARLLPATPWQGFVLGYVCGILWFAGTCYWIFDTMHRYGGMPIPAALALILFCMYVGLYHGMFGLLLALVAGSKTRGKMPAQDRARRIGSVDTARAGGGSVSLGRGGTCPHADYRVSMGASGILADRKFCAHADCDTHRRLRALV